MILIALNEVSYVMGSSKDVIFCDILQPVGAVDGNVIRVMSRLRTIGAPADSKQALDHIS